MQETFVGLIEINSEITWKCHVLQIDGPKPVNTFDVCNDPDLNKGIGK
jgi:hypothetical protein